MKAKPELAVVSDADNDKYARANELLELVRYKLDSDAKFLHISTYTIRLSSVVLVATDKGNLCFFVSGLGDGSTIVIEADEIEKYLLKQN